MLLVSNKAVSLAGGRFTLSDKFLDELRKEDPFVVAATIAGIEETARHRLRRNVSIHPSQEDEINKLSKPVKVGLESFCEFTKILWKSNGSRFDFEKILDINKDFYERLKNVNINSLQVKAKGEISTSKKILSHESANERRIYRFRVNYMDEIMASHPFIADVLKEMLMMNKDCLNFSFDQSKELDQREIINQNIWDLDLVIDPETIRDELEKKGPINWSDLLLNLRVAMKVIDPDCEWSIEPRVKPSNDKNQHRLSF